GGVAARRRFGEPPRADLLAARERRQEPLLLIGGAEQENVRRAQAVVRGNRQRHARVDARELLDAQAVVDRRHRRATILFRELNAQAAERRQLRPPLGWG